MKAFYISFGAIIICSVQIFSSAKPFTGEDTNFSEEKLQCMDSAEGSDYDKSSQNSFNSFLDKSRSRFETPQKFNKPSYYEKRSLSNPLYEINNENNGYLQKRQVGVVYKDEKPIGILQPFQRSYRFIPIKEENSFEEEENQEFPNSVSRISDTNKREAFPNFEDSYPSILTNFKIGTKLDKKRNFDAFTDENVQDLKSTIRKLRSSNSHNTEQIEEELKNILNDMGLIDDEESGHAQKREAEDQKEEDSETLLDDESPSANERNKRDDACSSEESKAFSNSQEQLTSDTKKIGINGINSNTDNNLVKRKSYDETDSDFRRRKRQRDMSEGFNSRESGADLEDDVKDTNNLMSSGSKSQLTSNSEIMARDTEKEKMSQDKNNLENDDYENRMERQIQSKINSLKEEVKREIAALKKKQHSDEDTQRKKRQVLENLADEEREELNPVKNIDQELKPLIRKRRSAASNNNSSQTHSRRKRDVSSYSNAKTRRNAQSTNVHNSDKKYSGQHDENEEGGELLGEDFDEKSVTKRETYGMDREYDDLSEENGYDSGLYDRSKRSRSDLYDGYLYKENYFDDYDNARFKRQDNVNDDFQGKVERKRFVPMRSYRMKPRQRRRIDDQLYNRPQQLSDMSDLDLFGALPKSYNGELSRYKRVKKK